MNIPASPSPHSTTGVPSLTPPIPDERASQEAASYAQGNLEEEARKNDHDRKESFKCHLHNATICAFWVVCGGVGAMAAVWLYHVLTPMGWHFLDNDQVGRIQGMLFSSLITAVFSGVFKKLT